MKTSSVILSLAAAVITSAQDPYYNITTPPFYLVVTSEDESINSTLSACHVGAALESLCLSNADYGSSPTPLAGAEFHFNTSIYSQPTPPDPTTGILTWWLTVNGGEQYPSSASFYYDPTTDIAVPILYPGDQDATTLAFDAQNQLAIQAYVRDTNGTGVSQTLYRWYACKTYYSSYLYTNLAWGLGASEPENPSCVAVNVTRVFV